MINFKSSENKNQYRKPMKSILRSNSWQDLSATHTSNKSSNKSAKEDAKGTVERDIYENEKLQYKYQVRLISKQGEAKERKFDMFVDLLRAIFQRFV